MLALITSFSSGVALYCAFACHFDAHLQCDTHRF